MRKLLIFLLFTSYTYAQSTTKTIHIYVALCDNANQGIVPVPASLGNGQNPTTNLYWGALYGVKTHFKRAANWEFIKTLPVPNTKVLERVLFKHKSSETYLLADAYDGKYIKQTTIDFLLASSGAHPETIKHNFRSLNFGGNANLLGYTGHDGLMEFDLTTSFKAQNDQKRDAIILACISKDYFLPYLKQTGANPLVWSTGLMAPEAYTLKGALEAWIENRSDSAIREAAAQAYHKYQKCGIRGARNLLVTGY